MFSDSMEYYKHIVETLFHILPQNKNCFTKSNEIMKVEIETQW
jgi:hypothetical protein